MTDSIAISPSLAGLLEAESADASDWDSSALADWPNIALGHGVSADPATTSPAEPSAMDTHQAC